MQSYDRLIVDVEDGKVTFDCAFCSRRVTFKVKTFERKPLCMPCILRTKEFETTEDSIHFLRVERAFAKAAFEKRGLVLLETKQTFKPSSKSVCGCETCGKKHKALLSDLLRENYEVCASKRTQSVVGLHH
nr:hypothetical protein MarQu_408 [Marseillevirus sp.]